MTRSRGALLLLALAVGCDAPGDVCISFPGPDVEAGLYALDRLRAWPDSVALAGLPYVDATDLTIELSPDRSGAIVRYVRDGSIIEEAWSVRIVP